MTNLSFTPKKILKNHMYNRGKIVLVPFPFTDLSAQKVRPALIISSTYKKSKDVVVLFISSRSTFGGDKFSYVIKRGNKNFERSGLKVDSIFRCDKIATLDKKIVLGEIGELSINHMKKIDKLIKGALGL